MIWQVKCGDIIDEKADVLICSANINLNLSGGVGGELLVRYGMDLQRELHKAVENRPGRFAIQGEVFETRLESMPYLAVFHAVAVDPMYQTDARTVSQIVVQCLSRARALGARQIALAALGTGFGNLTLEEFAESLSHLPIDIIDGSGSVSICLTEKDRVDELADAMTKRGMILGREKD